MVKSPLQKVEIYKTDDDGVITGTNIELTEVSNIQIMKGIDETKDTFSFEIPTYRYNGSFYNTAGNDTTSDKIVKVNDVIAISAKYTTDTTWGNEHLLIFGNVQKLTYTDSSKKSKIQVTGTNRTEELLRGMVPYTTYGTTTNAEKPDDIIINLFNRLNKHNPNHKLFVAKDSTTIPETGSAGGIATKRSDGTAFPTVEYTATWKPLYMQLENLSKPDYTSDATVGQYVFYVKPTAILPAYQDPALKNGPYADVLYWTHMGSTFSGSIIEGQGVTDINILHDIRDVVNAAIVNAGTDLNGAGILTVAYDLDSMSKHGAKWTYYTKSDKTFGRIRDNEITNAQKQGSIFNAETGYPGDAGSYPWNFQYDLTAGDSAADAKEYNQKLRDKAKSLAGSEALSVISYLKKPRYDITFDLEIGSNNYTMGNIYYFQVPSFGWDGTSEKPGYMLRLRDETHIIGDNGWSTRITAREDEEIVQDIVEANN